MMKISEMPKYEVYKDSGVEWIGKIPEHWNLKSLKRVVKEHSGNGFPIELQGQAGDIPFLKVSDLSCEGILVDKSSNRVSHKVVQKQKWNIVPAGSLVTAKIGEALRKNHRKLLAYDSIIDNNCIAFECVKIEKKYNFYLHLVIDFDWFVNPGAVPSISVSKYKSQKVVVPSMKEQVLIANFLDKKTALIDEAISIKEQQISLLKERKQIIIQQAVTQGLDPNVPMKDSGVDWIGKIPAHWDIVPGFTVFKEGKDSNKGMIESQVLSLSYGNVIIKPEEKLVGLVPESFETYQIALPGDIIIRCTDLQNDKTSLRTGIVRNKGIITSAYLNLRLKTEHSAEFMHYFLHALDITKTIYRFGSGLRQNLSYKDFKHMRILMPPKAEQIEIVNYINNQVEVTESSIDLIKNKIEKLKEYKTTLINSAVTGKIKITPEMVEQ
ncbi:restriction endonuclease subunit S [Escherichia coli]|uniref:Type I restriction-modification system, specificity subunit S n=2 Tax=Escherichia coli TaxID=562 RepID=A0A1U9XD55_ECOLX|nr:MULTISPECIES: restriction endonuclease subunit S [Enterobacteriaceae]AQZ19246.1 Type I restriction-modification system, specificity subunit S [Escherichia coli]AUR80427.1 Type I restriction-modification system, specificity subunit S [Escherichia coli]AYL89923.1 restriction endonuclease subunit S [Escherichia coli]EAY9556370.1 restriction endonuclease subunit S [Salmonella enterica]EJE4858137.1 restriction endonuclease subunit S [Escherichia coli]